MSALAVTGTVVSPGEVLYTEPVEDATQATAEAVAPGPGTFVRLVEAAAGGGGGAERQIVALRLGIAQWDGALVSVYARKASASGAAAAVMGDKCEAAAVASAKTVFGPRPGDVVHMRVTRLTRLAAAGEIMAVNGVWCASGGSLGRQEGFRGVIRVEDIRPFKPSKELLQPPPPSHAFQPGDVVVAEVISQSDVRQYQLSTLPNRCGVVESTVATGGYGCEVRHRLEHIPGRRDAMLSASDGAVHCRWTPLLEL